MKGVISSGGSTRSPVYTEWASEGFRGLFNAHVHIFLVEPSKNVGTPLSLPVNCNSRLHRNALKMPPVFPVLSSFCLSPCFSLYVTAVFVA